MKQSLLILLLLCFFRFGISQIDQFPQIYWNGQGAGGANLNIKSAPSLGSSNETSLLGLWQIGAVSEEISSEQQGFASWAKVCLPTVNGQIKFGYILYGEFYGRISAANTYATVIASNLNIREGPGTGYPIVKISGQNATYSQNSIVALTGNENGVWYEVYLPNNCNIASKRGWLSSENNYLIKNNNTHIHYNIAGRVKDENNVAIWGADVHLGSFGTANSTEGFYQYKLPIGWSGNITCEHPNYNSSIPQLYFHIANSHTYNNRDFVLSNASQTCVHWSPSPPADQKIIEATEYLCDKSIISEIQTIQGLNNSISISDLAVFCFNSLFYTLNDTSFSDNFPSPFIDISNIDQAKHDAILTMLYLEYDDGIPCFERFIFTIGPDAGVYKGIALRAILESWKIVPDWNGYNPNSTNNSWFLCDIKVNDPYYGYFQKAFTLGLLSDITNNNCGGNCTCIYPNLNISFSELYSILYKTMIYKGGIPPKIDLNSYFIPNTINPFNFSSRNAIDRGIFEHYENQNLDISSGGLGLTFWHSYHSQRSELPYLPFRTLNELNTLWINRLNPLGFNWSHSYNMYIMMVPKSTNEINASKYIINWADQTIQAYDYILSKYETIGIHDQFIINSKDKDGNIKNVTILKPNGMKYIFEQDSKMFAMLNLIEIRDKNNNSITLTYELGVSVGLFSYTRLKNVTDNTSGRSLEFKYKTNTNFIESVSDNIGRKIQYNVNANSVDLDDFTDAKNQRTQYLYGVNEKEKHLLKEVILPKGNRIINTYFNRKLKSSSNNQYNLKVDWNQNYFSGGNTNSTITSTQNGQSYETNYSHDNRGNPINITAPTGENVTIQYNDPNNPDLPTQINDNSKGLIYNFQYDNLGNTKIKLKKGGSFVQSEVFNFNNFSQITSYIDAKSNQTKYEYSSTGDLERIIAPNGTVTIITNNTFGNPLSKTNPSGIKTLYGYNNFGNLNSIEIEGSGIKTYSNYDQVSRIISTVDPKGIRDSISYDNNDNIINEYYDPSGLNLRTNQEYDNNDNLTRITDPRGLFTDLQYDFSTDDLLSELHGGQQKKWNYNTDGSIKSFTNKNGNTFNYVYAPVGDPLAGKILSDGYATFSYYSGSKELNQISYNGKAITYSYDELFRIKNIIYNDVLSGNSVVYDYDLNNNIIGIRYPFINKYITYEYDNLDRLTRIKDWNQNSLVEYYYLSDGRLDYEKFGNGVQTNYYYDNAGRMDSIATKKSNGNILITVGASLDLNGNHTRESIFMPFVNGPGQGSVLNSNTNYQYSGNSNLLQNSTGNNFNTYQYTKNGATKDIQGSGGHILLNWDEKDRLTSFQNIDSGKTHLFEYDGLGNRRRLNDTRYALDILHGSNVLVETNLTGNPKSFYVHGLGLVCRIDPQTGAISYYHSDFRGSTLGITNASQDFTHQYQYEEFGQVERKFEAVYNNPFQFVGKHGIMYDETGLSFMRARYYDASIGRFLSEDPVWGNNLFDYADNNPIVNIDPLGLKESKSSQLFKQTMREIKETLIRSFSDKSNYSAAFDLALMLAGGAEVKVSGQFTKSSLKLGQKMHKSYKVGVEGFKEFRLPSGKRIDFLDVKNGNIFELKPRNPRAIKAGQIQLKIYKIELQSMPEFKGINWKTILDTY